MQKDTKQNRSTPHKVRSLFDQTLGRHIERLLGAKYGIGALPMNLATISCLILLAERETEIDSLASNPSERYTYETLLKELAEISLDSYEDLEVAFQDMIQKGYIDVDGDGRFSAKKSTISMAQLLERAFPEMPGMNLIAYFVQTVDEVQSGRKDLDSAISQLDQVLQMQGVSLLEQITQPKPEKAPRPPVDRETKRWKTKKPRISRSGPKILSSNGNLGQFEISEIFVEQDEPPQSYPEIDEVTEAQKPEIPEEAKQEEPAPEEKPVEFTPPAETEGSYVEPKISSETLSRLPSEPGSDKRDLFEERVSVDTALEDGPSTQEEPLHVSEPIEQETGASTDVETQLAETKSLRTEATLHQAETKYEEEIVSQEEAIDKGDQILEKRIASFEEDLAMQCPMCRKAEVQRQETATGKIYYKCSNENCNFISWGKPHHLVCPQCGNAFLVETSGRDGKTILKCPRATCRYWQKLPGEIGEEPTKKAPSLPDESAKSSAISKKPRRRVVRRRVARRKR